LDHHAEGAAFQQAPMRLYLTEDFHEAEPIRRPMSEGGADLAKRRLERYGP
jgi:hypothetical protein